MADSDIDALVKATIQTKILEAFKQGPELIEELVKAALSKPVDQNNGLPPRDSWSKSMPYLDYLVGQTIRDAAASSVREIIRTEVLPQVEAAVRARLPGAPDKIVDGLMAAILKATGEDWQIDVNFTPKRE